VTPAVIKIRGRDLTLHSLLPKHPSTIGS